MWGDSLISDNDDKPSRKSGCLTWIVIAVVAVVALEIYGRHLQQGEKAAREQAIETGYWFSDFNVAISKALAANDAHGCGEYRYLSLDSDDEYLVECFDGMRKRWYRVFPKIESVLGPYNSMPTN